MKKRITIMVVFVLCVGLALFYSFNKEPQRNGDIHGLQVPPESGIPSSFFKITKFKTQFSFTRSEAKRKDQEFYYYYLVGLNHFYAEDKHVALDHFKKALEYNDKYTPLHISLAEVYIDLGDYDVAEQHCRKALELDANNNQARLMLSSIQSVSKNYDKAISQLEKILADDPSNEDVLARLL